MCPMSFAVFVINAAINGVDSGGAVLVFASPVNLFLHLCIINKNVPSCNKFQFSSISWYDLVVFMGAATAEEDNHKTNPHMMKHQVQDKEAVEALVCITPHCTE